MARTGNFGGFQFDEEVFAGMMQETDPWETIQHTPSRTSRKPTA